MPDLASPFADQPLAWPRQAVSVSPAGVAAPDHIYCVLRQRWFTYTPEEWVRQQLAAWLLGALGYPASLMAAERGIALYGQRRRFDLLAYDRQGAPLLLAECKAPGVRVGEGALVQLELYSRGLPARVLVATNGNTLFIWRRADAAAPFQRVAEVPPFSDFLS
jgi:hypothetical protein